jgi:splicing factor 3A subunit 3
VLEHARGKQAELEAMSIFSSQLLQHAGESNLDASDFTPGIQEAWKTVSTVINQDAATASASALQQQQLPLVQPKWEALPLGRSGQWKQTVQTQVLANSLKRTATLAADIQAQRLIDGGPVLEKAVQTAQAVSDPTVWLQIFDQRLSESQAYHARHDTNMDTMTNGTSSSSGGLNLAKRPRSQVSAAADGYDLSSSVHTWLQPVQDETLFSSEEVMGKYIDLLSLYTTASTQMKDVFVTKAAATTASTVNKAEHAFLYNDFLQILSDGLPEAVEEASKLQHRKKYVRFLQDLEKYLHDFLGRTYPLLPVSDVTAPAVKAFEQEWSETGGVEGWEAKPAEASLVQVAAENGGDNIGHGKSNGDHEPAAAEVDSIDLSGYSDAEALEAAVDGDRLKTELARLGLKCGGTVSDRAKRLFLLKDTPLDQLPAKVFAKKPKNAVDSNAGGGGNGTSIVAKNESRVDIVRREAIVTALLSQLRPTLEATIRRTERRQTQTLLEREREVDEELFGSEIAEQASKKQKSAKDDDSDDSDEDDAPVYNPKNIPLDWDGKPMPYWLYKLHGLQHYYDCQICGGETYRGRRNFELHFADQKHALGMKSLGIPNTKHFHGVTKIDDAIELWKSLQGKLQEEQFDGTKEEEYEDSHGNVLSRTTYEDLARQGLL